MKTSGCISIFRFTFDSPFSICQWCRPPLYVAVQHSSILYVGSRVAWLYRLIHLLWSGTWRFSYLFDQTSSCTIFDQLSICDTWTLIQTCISGPCSDDSLCTFSSAILVYMLDLFSTFYMMYFWLSMGMPASAWVDSLVSFIGFWQAEIWWSPLLSLRSSFYVHNTFRPSCTPSDLIY